MVTQVPHVSPAALLPERSRYLEPMLNFAGMLEYLGNWRWCNEAVVEVTVGVHVCITALPLLISQSGEVCTLGEYHPRGVVFPSQRACFDYLEAVAEADLRYRGFRDDRIAAFGIGRRRTCSCMSMFRGVRMR